MKKLKLNHRQAVQIVAGGNTKTWRLFDDKDLTVNDRVSLIDKVKPDQPQTWKVIGVARINKVIEKNLGDITDDDYEGDERFETHEDMLETFRGYYGDNVTWDTPVKIISFDFTPGSGSPADDPEGYQLPRSLSSKKIIVYADGGSRGNPGPSACGYILMTHHEEVLVDKAVYLGITTNNQAEYQGLKFGLEEAKKMGAREVAVRLDSLLVVNQMKGIFKVKNRDLWPIHDSIKELLKSFDRVTFTHVPRELNQLADAAVNRILDETVGRKQ